MELDKGREKVLEITVSIAVHQSNEQNPLENFWDGW